MTPEQKLFYLSLYLGADIEILLGGTRFALCGVNTLSESINLDPGDEPNFNIKLADRSDIKLILKEEPASYHEDDKANKAYWEAYHGNETLCGKLYTGLRYDKLAGILWLIKNKYDIFNLKSQDLAIYENDLCTK